MRQEELPMFITFEGGEGSGKTTVISKVAEKLKEHGHEVLVTREPGSTKLGEHVRDCLLNPDIGFTFGSRAELLLYLASRVQHIDEVIRPAFSEGKVVLCDRFNDSSVAYQGGGRGLGIENVQQLCDLACGGLTPDLTFFLDLDPEVGMSRIERSKDRLEGEKVEFHQKVRDTYHQLAKLHPRIHVINASKPQEEVYLEVLDILDRYLTN